MTSDAEQPADKTPYASPAPVARNFAWAITDLPSDPLTREVFTQVQQAPEERTWMQTLFLLGVSLFFFTTSGLLSYNVPELLMLLGVLLFHELGHYAGMRLFNYQDVKMFFIPFFGAAVSGRSTSVAGYKEAIVILLGPLPGILLGLGLAAACLSHDDPLLRAATRTLLLINGFNLLPFMPLDGGRLLHLVLFSRQRHMEAAFRLLTGILLGVCGYFLGAWMLAGLGLFMVLSVGHTFHVSTLAQKLRAERPPTAETSFAAQIPADEALPLVLAVREDFPHLMQAKPLVNTVRQVWERLHIEPPGVLASLALLGLYAATLLGTPVLFVLFHLPVTDVKSHQQADGTPGYVQEVRVLGQLRESTEMNADREYHGRHVEYTVPAGNLAAEGSFHQGQPDGAWTFYGPDQVVEGSVTFRNGLVAERTGKVPDYLSGRPANQP